MIPISIQGLSVMGVLDSGANICLINIEIYKTLNPRPQILWDVYLRGISESMTLGHEFEITVKVGSKTIKALHMSLP